MRRQLPAARTLAELPADAHGVSWREWLVSRLDAIHAAGKRRHFERVQSETDAQPVAQQKQTRPVFGQRRAS